MGPAPFFQERVGMSVQALTHSYIHHCVNIWIWLLNYLSMNIIILHKYSASSINYIKCRMTLSFLNSLQKYSSNPFSQSSLPSHLIVSGTHFPVWQLYSLSLQVVTSEAENSEREEHVTQVIYKCFLPKSILFPLPCFILFPLPCFILFPLPCFISLHIASIMCKSYMEFSNSFPFCLLLNVLPSSPFTAWCLLHAVIEPQAIPLTGHSS